MERLTKREKATLSDGKEVVVCDHQKEDCDDSCLYGTCTWNKKAIEKLKAYEDAEEQGLLLRLPKEIQGIDEQMLKYALAKAVNLVKYGVDVDSKLEGAVETSYALHNAYMKGTKDAVDKMDEYKTEIKNKVIDEFTERLKERLKGMQMVELQGEDVCPCAETGEECPHINQSIGCQYCAREQTIKEVDEIAEKMKGGAECH